MGEGERIRGEGDDRVGGIGRRVRSVRGAAGVVRALGIVRSFAFAVLMIGTACAQSGSTPPDAPTATSAIGVDVSPPTAEADSIARGRAATPATTVPVGEPPAAPAETRSTRALEPTPARALVTQTAAATVPTRREATERTGGKAATRAARPAPSASPKPKNYLRAEGDYTRLPRRNRYEKAYSDYWQAMAVALRTGDTTDLERMATASALGEVQREIIDNRAQGLVREVHIETNGLDFLRSSGSTVGEKRFVVQHCYADRSKWLRADTGKPARGVPGADSLITRGMTFFELEGRILAVSLNLQPDESGSCGDDRVRSDFEASLGSGPRGSLEEGSRGALPAAGPGILRLCGLWLRPL